MPPELSARRRPLVVGRSGELAVTAELLLRGWIAARPEVDVGDDGIILDEDGTVWRIQVKSASAASWSGGDGHKAQFGLRLDQLRASPTPDLLYVFAVRVDERWADFVVVPREELRSEHELHGVGSEHDGRITLNLYVHRDGRITVGTSQGRQLRDWTRYRDRWPCVSTRDEAA